MTTIRQQPKSAVDFINQVLEKQLKTIINSFFDGLGSSEEHSEQQINAIYKTFNTKVQKILKALGEGNQRRFLKLLRTDESKSEGIVYEFIQLNEMYIHLIKKRITNLEIAGNFVRQLLANDILKY